MIISKQKLNIAMAKAKVSVKELQDVSGLSTATIAFAGSRHNSRPATIGKIADALGCQVEDLIVTEAAE